jgi:hypothetical protein
MSALSNYTEKLVLDWLMTAGAVTRPTTWYLALFTTDPTDAGTGTEVSGAGYARQSITFDSGSTPAGTTQNSNAPSFSASGGSFGTVAYVGIYDAITAGNLLWYGIMSSSQTINDGDTLVFSVGDIDLIIA